MRKAILFFVLLSTSMLAYTCPDATDVQVFPADNWWNWDISEFDASADSSKVIDAIHNTPKSGTNLHPDYGVEYGIPYSFAGEEMITLKLTQREETDFGPLPIPLDAPVEGLYTAGVPIPKYPNPHSYDDPKGRGGDKHVVVIDKKRKMLYEMFDALPQPQNSPKYWGAMGACTWDLTKNEMRRKGETSVDAAGFPIFPGLVRYDEVAKGEIKHAIRCTFRKTLNVYMWPASHKASKDTNPYLPQMGMRFRLKKDFDISGFSDVNKIVLTALKKHGMYVADNGGSWFITGSPDDRWKDDDIQQLKKALDSDFEVVKTIQNNGLPIYPKGIKPKTESVTGKRGVRK